jgi:hypothetical protein
LIDCRVAEFVMYERDGYTAQLYLSGLFPETEK